MIPANTRIWIVAGATDMRRGFLSLSGLVQTVLDQNPLSGNVYVFRGRMGPYSQFGAHLCLDEHLAVNLTRGR